MLSLNELNEADDSIIENCTKAQLAINKTSNIICKVILVKKIEKQQLTIAYIHILPNSTSRSAILMYITARQNEADRLIESLPINTFYKIYDITTYFDQYHFGIMTISFDKKSRVRMLELSPKLSNRFHINWLLQKGQITDDYEKQNIYQFVVAGFIHKLPLKKALNLHVITIKNKMKQTIDVNLWGQRHLNFLKNIKLNDIIILPKVSHAKVFYGYKALNNNGPIYIENKLWSQNETKNDSDLEIIDLSNSIKAAKSIFFLNNDAFFFNNDIFCQN